MQIIIDMINIYQKMIFFQNNMIITNKYILFILSIMIKYTVNYD
jgi:hypothetical protein